MHIRDSDPWLPYPHVSRTGGPERIYDADAAKEPLPTPGPFGFAPTPTPAPEQEPDLWEGDQA